MESHSNVLRSWKRIAQYLHCGVKTAKRWESQLGLPVHRLGRGRGSVLAFSNELDAWLRYGSVPAAAADITSLAADALLDQTYPGLASDLELLRKQLALHLARGENLNFAAAVRVSVQRWIQDMKGNARETMLSHADQEGEDLEMEPLWIN